MNKVFTLILSPLFIIFLLCAHSVSAQDNLRVQYEGTAVPDFLNICGDPDSETVRVSLNGNPGGALQSIQATAHLFQGVEMVSFDAAGSTPGVTLIPNSDPSNPVFSIPDLSATGQSFALVSFSVAAKCGYIDTLTANDMAVVLDAWEFDYQLGGASLNETQLNLEYRDAFAVPQFTVSVDTTVNATRVGDCLTRDIFINNSGLDGFVDTVFYENIQGRGIYVSEIMVNGLPLTITKSLTAQGDTLITGVIDGSFFVNNTSGVGAGNGDVFLDPDETVTVSESICVLDCDEDRTSAHTMSWGCDGRACTAVTVNDFIEIGEGAANVRIINTGSVPSEVTGYCKPGVSVVSFINDGVEVDNGFAAMMDVAVGVGLGDNFDLSLGTYDITAIRIAGVDIPAPLVLNFLDGNAAFTTDPDGPGGLEDLDGDGYFDDLGQNDTFEIVTFYEFDCSGATEPGDDGSCANAFSVSFNTRIDYSNQCAERLVRLEERYFSSSNTRSTVENFTPPDAFVEEDTFVLIHTQTRGVFSFDKDCDGNEVWKVSVVVPTGVRHIPSASSLFRNGSTFSVPMVSESMSNDTLTILYDASTTPFIGGEFVVEIGFAGDCTAELGQTVFPTTFSYVCPSCDCEHIWWCGDLEGPKLHATIPPCPPGTFVCPMGVQTTDFEINRTSFGFTDNTYSIPFDPAMANKKVGLSCDEVEMRLMNVIGDAPVSDSIGVVISYNNVDGSMSTDETFIFDLGTVRITNAGNEYICNVTPVDLTTVTVDSTQILTFDLDKCLTDNGLTLVAMDTVEFIGNFSINPDGPFSTQFLQVPKLRAYAYADIDGEEFACDNFGDNFTLAKSETVFNVPSSNSMPEGCEETFLNYQLVTVNNGFSDFFGMEFRQAIAIDSIRFDFEREVLDGFSVFEAEVSIPGHPIHGNNFFPVPGFETVADTVYVAYFDTLTAVPSLNLVQSYSFNFRIRVVPDCKSPNASANGNNQYNFDPTIFFKDRFYASVIGDGSCVLPITDSKDNDIFYTDPPTFSLNPVSDPNFELLGDTAIWEFQYCNTSFTADAGVSWLALEQAGTDVQIVSIQDVSIPSAPVNLMISEYGAASDNYFAFSPGLLQSNGSNPLNQICNTYLVKAIVNTCGTSNITARTGWNCTPYTDPAWNPEDYPPCSDLQLPLSVIPLDPFLDANIVEQPTTDPAICDTSRIAILLRNTQRGSVFDVNTQIILPAEGMTFVPGSFEVAYPSSAAFVPVNSDPTFVGTQSKGDVYEFTDFSQINPFLDINGLKGFDPLVPDSNEMIIRYQFVTDCDYTSGSLSFYSFQGIKGCGDTTNFETGETLPLEIDGAEPTGNKIFDIEFTPESALIPGESSELEIIVVNRAIDPTDTTDKVSLQLPPGVLYDLNSTSVVTPGTWTSNIEPTFEMNSGLQSVFWCLPAGVLQDDTIRFTLSVTSPFIDCAINNYDINLFTIHRTTLFCASGGISCDIDDITSSNEGSTTALPVLQNLLDIDMSSLTSICSAGDEEIVTVAGQINNPGSDFPTSNFTIRYFYDMDNDGTVSPGDPEISAHVEMGPILSGGSLPYAHDVPVTSSQACGLIVQLDTIGLGLCQPSEFPLGEPQLLNAGDDQLFCAIMPTTINTTLGDPTCLGLTGYTYNWRAIAPATTSLLSATDIPNPDVTIPHNAMMEDTLSYILETTRPACGSISSDTINIIRGLGVIINAPDTVYVLPGGSIDLGVIASNGSMPYTYNWEPAATLDDPTAGMPVATPIGDTEYSVTVTSATGCSTVETILVINDNAIVADIIPGDTLVCPHTELQLLAIGGTDYRWEDDAANPPGGLLSDYNIANPFFVGTESNQDYTFHVFVTNSNSPGFEDTASITISTLTPPDIQVINSPVGAQCAGEVTTLQATGADSYTWAALPSGLVQGTGDELMVSPIVPTSYIVYGPNAAGCIDTTEVFIDVITPPVVTTIINDFENCAGDTTALSISINEDIASFTIDGTGDFTNAVINGNTLDFDAIYINSPSDFTVTLVGAISGCQAIETFSITQCGCQPPVLTSVTLIEPICGNTDGFAMVRVEGPENAYEYTWIPEAGTIAGFGNIRENLPAGGYRVIIADPTDPSCSETVEVVLTNDDGPTATATTTPATCAANDGTVLLAPANLDYQWENGLPAGSIQNNLGAGNYFVTVTHPAFPDCPGIILVEIEEENNLTADVVTDVAPDCNFANGQVTVNVSGGSGSYLYSFPSGTNTQDGLAAGMHVVTIIDAGGSGCTLEVPFMLINNVPEGVVTIDSEDAISCPGENDGVANFTVAYDVAFDAPADTMITDGINIYENGNLPPGEYCIIITDEGGCVAGGDCFTIEEPDYIDLLFIVEPDCSEPGSVDVTVNGGTGPYTIDWDDLPGNNNIVDRSGLSAGTYPLTVTDAVGCTLAEDVSVTNDCPCTTPDVNSILVVESQCNQATGSATINMVGDNTGFNYTWSPDLGVANTEGNIRTSLPFGGYTVEITELGDPTCTTEALVLVTNLDGPEATAITTPATCQAADGTVTLSPASFTFAWEDGSTASTRDDLAEGSYFVTLTDPANGNCSNVMLVEIESENPLSAIANVDVQPTCGLSDGAVTIAVTGGSGNYTFIWGDGLVTTDAARTGLTGGANNVIIRDNDLTTGCELEFVFVLVDNVPGATMTLDSVHHISCFGNLDGAVDFSIVYNGAFNGVPDTIITDGINVYENGNLPEGNYCVMIQDGAGCTAGSLCFEIEAPEDQVIVATITPVCDAFGSIDIEMLGGTAPYTYNWADLSGSDNSADRMDLIIGTYALTVTDARDCVVSEDNIIVPTCDDNGCDFFNGESAAQLTHICGETSLVCIDLDLNNLNNYVVTVNGSVYMGAYEGCDWDTLITYSYNNLFGMGNAGPYSMDSWVVGDSTFTGSFQDIPELVILMNSLVPTADFIADTAAQVIVGMDANLGFGSMVVEATDFGASSILTSSLTGSPAGLGIPLDTGFYEIIVLDTVAFCADTLLVNVSCANVFLDDICFGETKSYCIDTMNYSVRGISSFRNICEDASGTSVVFDIDSLNRCISYTGLTLGTDTACLEICDLTGLCDTIELLITTNSCTVDGPELVIDTIFIGEDVIYCPDSSGLAGPIEFIDNFCADESNGNVDFFVNPETFCLEYTGIELGKDTACVVICDASNFCDTTYFCVVVEPYFETPEAVDDTARTFTGTPVVIDIKANDVLFGGLDTAYLLTQPSWGTATLNLDCSVTYNPEDETCERWDNFDYVICNPNGCDTAMISVFIECTDIVIFTAVSPNGDGINDVFYIAGIEDFPEAELVIYNRWGNEVFESANYQNDWGGTWNGDKDLPDGTYYYFLKLNDEDNRNFKGFFELYR